MKTNALRKLMNGIFNYSEDVLYLIIGTLLIVCSAFLVIHTVQQFFDFPHVDNFIWWIVKILDKILLLLMLLEILYTVRVSFTSHSLCAEPFLIVALIAGVRRILVLSVETAYFPDHFQHDMIEIGILGLLIFIFVVSIILLRNRPPFNSETHKSRKES